MTYSEAVSSNDTEKWLKAVIEEKQNFAKILNTKVSVRSGEYGYLR